MVGVTIIHLRLVTQVFVVGINSETSFEDLRVHGTIRCMPPWGIAIEAKFFSIKKLLEHSRLYQVTEKWDQK